MKVNYTIVPARGQWLCWGGGAALGAESWRQPPNSGNPGDQAALFFFYMDQKHGGSDVFQGESFR
jgi:hypothetical protein